MAMAEGMQFVRAPPHVTETPTPCQAFPRDTLVGWAIVLVYCDTPEETLLCLGIGWTHGIDTVRVRASAGLVDTTETAGGGSGTFRWNIFRWNIEVETKAGVMVRTRPHAHSPG